MVDSSVSTKARRWSLRIGGPDDTGQIEPPRRVSITSDIPPIFPKGTELT